MSIIHKSYIVIVPKHLYSGVWAQDSGSFKRLRYDVLKYLAVASLSLNAATAVQVEISRDDRLVKRCDEVMNIMYDNYDYTCKIQKYTYVRTSRLVGCTAEELETWVGDSVLCTIAVMKEYIVDQFFEDPLVLARGNIEQNLQTLATRTTPITDCTIKQIKLCLETGF